MANVPTYKVIVAGDGSVGKTSLLRRQTAGRFTASRVMTIGVEFHVDTIRVGRHTIKLSIWDIGGQKRFAGFRRMFYRGAVAGALVFDVTDRDTFIALPHWREEVLSIAPYARLMVVGNKIDMPREIEYDEARAWSLAMRCPYVEVSAMTGHAVDRIFEGLGWLAVKNTEQLQPQAAAT
ncbi:MAG: GTP-binding protein [Chloroflexi bacterium]|nr:GTP-binding protein [Chloroflexota bacterium]